MAYSAQRAAGTSASASPAEPSARWIAYAYTRNAQAPEATRQYSPMNPASPRRRASGSRTGAAAMPMWVAKKTTAAIPTSVTPSIRQQYGSYCQLSTTAIFLGRTDPAEAEVEQDVVEDLQAGADDQRQHERRLVHEQA